MWIANAGFLYSVRRADPWLRVGYEALSYSFDKDASGFFSVPNPPGVIPGGYYSPQLYLLQQLRAEATLATIRYLASRYRRRRGPQMVRSATQQFEDWHWGVGARARIEAQFAPEVRACFSYDFLNAGAADHRSVFLVGAEVRF